MNDALSEWLQLRRDYDWCQVEDVLGPITPTRDGHGHFIHTVGKARDPKRASALFAALEQVREDASIKAYLDFDRLCRWQQIVLDTTQVSFRTGPAFAKDGRERYSFDSNTQPLFVRCLDEANIDRVPIVGRASRAYFDIIFFHPFPDGNARSAALVLDFILARQNIFLDQVSPLYMIERSPTLVDVQSFMELLDVLAKSTLHRKLHVLD
jgi:hypothetical protein